jgi:hypothetical protein
MPYTSMPSFSALTTTVRTALFMPWLSSPLVITAIFFNFTFSLETM